MKKNKIEIKIPDNVKNKKLYLKIRNKYKNMPNSAYRSGLIVKQYKNAGGVYKKAKTKQGLTRWFKEDWKTQEGKKTYNSKSDIFRPTKKINKKTPKLLKNVEINKKRKEKLKKGRVKKF